MSTSATTGVVGQLGAQDPTGNDAFNKVGIQDFIKMLVAELQNQDPMNPMSNSEMLQQISQIKAIQSNQQLSDTLQSLQLQQDVTAASTLIGRTITALTNTGDNVSGKVDKVSIAKGATMLHVGDQSVELKNVSEIAPAGA